MAKAGMPFALQIDLVFSSDEFLRAFMIALA
jgi:hypothetical protein